MRISVFSCCLLLVAAGCRDKKKIEPADEKPAPASAPAASKTSYWPLAAGNYWIYDRYRVELDGTSQNLGQRDSCYVIKDTTIRNHRYWLLRKYDFAYSREERLCLRDSSGCLTDRSGNIIFAPDHIGKTLRTEFILQPDTLCQLQYRMGDMDLQTTVPAGTFKTSAMQMVYTFRPEYTVPQNPNPRIRNFRYAKGVGPVVETEEFYLQPSWMHERRLVRYKVQ